MEKMAESNIALIAFKAYSKYLDEEKGTFYMDERCGPIDIVLAEREKYYNV